MSFRGGKWLVRWGLGALALLLAHGLTAPAAALAGCGHDVTSSTDRRHAYDRLDDLILGVSSTMPTDERGQPIPSPYRPCNGPGCKSSTPRPVSTTSSGPGGPDQWLAMAAALGLFLPSPPHPLPDDPAARPEGHGPSIFHPPPA